jgi:short-subunit dehydrogenase
MNDAASAANNGIARHAPANARPGPLVIAITGASSGIGEAAARRLAAEPGASLVLVARRAERLRELASSLGDGRASWLALDLLDEDAPRQIAEHVVARHGRLDLLVNNAGASWRARFADGGYENVRRTMSLNFDAQVRVTEALLPLLRASAPSAIVNVCSTSGRVARPGAGAYSASKFALAGWSDSLWAEERANGVHVGLVMPGFIATEGFPAAELLASRWTRWIVSTPERAAEAIYDAGPGRRPERWVPRPYALAAAMRTLAPPLLRRVLSGPRGAATVTGTGADAAERASIATARSDAAARQAS